MNTALKAPFQVTPLHNYRWSVLNIPGPIYVHSFVRFSVLLSEWIYSNWLTNWTVVKEKYQIASTFVLHKVLQKWFSPHSNPFAKFEKKAFGKYGEAKVEFGVIANMFDYV